MKTKVILILLMSFSIAQVVAEDGRYVGQNEAHCSFNSNAPTVADDFYATDQNTPLEVPNPMSTNNPILANDFDPDGDNLMVNLSQPDTIVSMTDTTNTLIIFPNGNIEYTPGEDFVGTDSFEYEVCDDGTPVLCDIGVIFITVEACVDIQLAVFLEGCFNIGMGEMNTYLNLLDGSLLHRGILPGQEKLNIGFMGISITKNGQPYDQAPWNYNGIEGTFDAAPWFYAPGSTDPMGEPSFAVYHPDVVDWVLVRFRTGTPFTSMTTVGTAAGLLFKDGTVRFLEPCVLRGGDVPGNLVYAQIDHRNHMGVMTPNEVDISGSTLVWDFRIQESYRTSTSFSQKEIVPGTFVMYTGDGDQVSDIPSYDINGFDHVLWAAENGIFDTYINSDFDMNADVNGGDQIIWSTNNGISSRVPR